MITTAHLSLYVTPDEQAMALEAARIIKDESRKAISERGVFTLAISGGHTPIPLFRLLAGPEWKTAIDWGRTEVYWVDEHNVRPEHEESNYNIARRELLTKVDATRFYRMKGEENPAKAALDYEELLRNNLSLKPGELPRFDCVILGVGTDGHTGSLFPNDPSLAEKDRLVVDVYNTENPPSRVTLTMQVLNNSRCCIFLASGRSKNHVLFTALNLMAAPVLPAQMVRPTDGKLCWIIDNNAYQG